MPQVSEPASTEVRTKKLTPEERKAASGSSELDDIFGEAPDESDYVQRNPANEKPDEVVVVSPEDKQKPKVEDKPRLLPAKQVQPDDDTEAPVPVRRPKILPAIPKQEEEDEVVDVEPTEQKEEPQVVKPAATDDTPEDRLAKALAKVFPQPKVEEVVKVPELTDEERDAVLKVYKPAPDLVTRLTNPESAAAAVQELIQGMRQEQREFAYQVSKGLLDKTLSERDRAQMEVQQQTQTKEQVRAQFYTSYPVLKEERFSGIVAATATMLQKEGYVPTNATEMQKTLAERVEKEVKKFDPSFSVSSKTQPNQPSTNIPKPRATTPGGGKGGAVNLPQPKVYKRAAGTEVFD